MDRGSSNLVAVTLKFSCILFIISTCSSSDSDSASSSSSIYEALRSNGLPIGILPKGIRDFTFDQSTGRFEVHLEQSCDAKFETHVRYDFNVSGTLSYGQIDEISGVVAQDLFLWFPVKGIRVDIPSSGLIYFDVGVVFKQFSLSLFETPRDCTVTNDSSGSAPASNHLLLPNSIIEQQQQQQQQQQPRLILWKAG